MEIISEVILGLIAFLQLIFIFMLTRIFLNFDTLYERIISVEKDLRDKIEDVRSENTRILDKHYVTTGQLNTLEEKLIGQIKNLAMSIEHLTDAITNSRCKGN